MSLAELSGRGEELEQRYRQAKDGVERSHYQVIWLPAQGKPSKEVAELTGYSRSWVYELVWGYNRLGADSLGDKRHHNSIRWFGYPLENNPWLWSTGSLSGWLVGFVRPSCGETYRWTVAVLNHQVFSRLLVDFADHFGISQHQRVILVVDQTPFYLSDKVQVPEEIHLLFLPSKSPELQPAEQLWPLTNEAISQSEFCLIR